jgi:hypothetical protein
MIIVIIVIGVLLIYSLVLLIDGLTYGSGSPPVSPRANFVVATKIKPVLDPTIGQPIGLETAFPAEIDVYTPIYK